MESLLCEIRDEDIYMEYRGFSKACYRMLESRSDLRMLLDCVCNDSECCVEVRHNYLNCYYRGGSIFRMEFKPRLKKLKFKFDSKYFSLKSPGTSCEELEAWNASGSGDPKEWLKQLPTLKQTMDVWFKEHPKTERETQQKIVKQNIFAQGNYQSIDIELAIPNHKEYGRMDIIAVRREKERYVPVIVELKHGEGAFDGKSGILTHYKNMTNFLDEEGGEEYLRETICRIWEAKRVLKILKEPAPDVKAFDRAELLFAVTDWKKENIDNIRKRLPETLGRVVRVATSPTDELSFDAGVRL